MKNKHLFDWTGKVSSFRGCSFSQKWGERFSDLMLLLSVILAGTAFPRLMLSGGFPRTDDGYYVYVAQYLHHYIAGGYGMPDTGGLSLYPLLNAWVFSLNYNPFIALRLVDLVVAVFAAILFYAMLKNESGSRVGAAVITLIFSFTLNQEIFIEHGFKNSITAAFIPLFGAICIGQRILQGRIPDKAWWIPGALVALAVTLREPFALFSAVGLIIVFIAGGKKPALRFLCGGVVSGMLLIGGILLWRGGVSEALLAYKNAGIVYGAVPDYTILDHFIGHSRSTMVHSLPALIISVAALFFLAGIAFVRKNKKIILRLGFWLTFIAAGLVEPIMKIGFSYHFAIILPAFAGICALALREIICIWPAIARIKWLNEDRKNFMMIGGVVTLSIWVFLRCSALADYWPMTLETLAAAPGGNWPEKFTGYSNYLLAAREIKKEIPENGTLSVSGNMHALYPLTGHLPPSRLLDNLSATTILLNLSVPAIQQTLLDCAPDVIMTTTRNDWATGGGSARLLEAVIDTGIYEVVTKIHLSNERHYGGYGGLIFRKTKETVCLTK
ncbi:MAG: hypothetical protein LBJ59_04465 [Zoogloeaceae bacterium]|jgi:hypothetical protein|nr:hypothetical protein [Zoogloeaceae bacterium]